jgi:hypothetical protein
VWKERRRRRRRRGDGEWVERRCVLCMRAVGKDKSTREREERVCVCCKCGMRGEKREERKRGREEGREEESKSPLFFFFFFPFSILSISLSLSLSLYTYIERRAHIQTKHTVPLKTDVLSLSSTPSSSSLFRLPVVFYLDRVSQRARGRAARAPFVGTRVETAHFLLSLSRSSCLAFSSPSLSSPISR